MQEFGAGAQSVAQAQMAPMLVQEEAIKLQDMVDPELRNARKNSLIAESDIKQLQATIMKDSVATDASAKKTIQEYYSKPENKDKPPADAMDDLAKITMGTNYKLGMKFAEDAGKLREEQAKAAKAGEDAQDAAMNHAFSIAQSIDPNDTKSMEKAIMDAHVNGLDTTQFRKDVQVYGPKQAKENLLHRLTTIKRQDEERKEAASLAQALTANKRLDLESQRIEAIFTKMEYTNAHQAKAAEDKQAAAVDKLDHQFNADTKQAYEQYQKSFNKAKSLKDTEAMQDANDEYESTLSGLNSRYAPLYAEKDADFDTRRIGNIGTKAAPEKGDKTPAKQDNSSEDAQAEAWAKANPTDPRAKQIMDKLGKTVDTPKKPSGPGELYTPPRSGKQVYRIMRRGQPYDISIEEAKKKGYI